MASHNSMIPAIAKLLGRENFCTWQFAVQAYLEHEGLWKSIVGEGTEAETDEEKLIKAKSKLILLVDPVNFVHIQGCQTAKAMWNALKTAFTDKGLTRRVSLIRTLTSTRLIDCATVEEYVQIIMNAAHKLRGINCEVADEWLATFMLAGLPEKYQPMIMALENSGINITADFIKTKLLQDITSAEHESSKAFYLSKGKCTKKSTKNPEPSSSQNRIQCFSCRQYGHKSFNCPEKKKKSNVSKNVNKSKFGAFVVSSDVLRDEDWFLDSASSFHMSPRADWMQFQSVKPIDHIIAANNAKLEVRSAGVVQVKVSTEDDETEISINNVLHVPDLSSNLLSVSQLCQKGHTVVFKNDGCQIFNGDMDLVATGRHVNNMFLLNVVQSRCYVAEKDSEMLLWHRRMGHLNHQDLCKVKNMAEGIVFPSTTSVEPCIDCLKGKQSRFPFSKHGNRATKLLELVHSDLCGPMEHLSIGKARYFITFIDDFSRKVFVYFLSSKTGILEIFRNFKSMVENQTECKIQQLQPRSSKIVEDKCGNTIKILRADNGGEYVNREFENYLKSCGIRFQSSCPYTPQQNGLAERMNRTLVEKARCMLFGAKLDKSFWAESISTAAYLTNRSPNRNLEMKTPEEIWSGKIPDLSHLKVFGCKAMVHVPKKLRQKLDAKSEEFIFVGYCEETKGFRLIHPITKKLKKSRDVVFLENQVIGDTMNSQVSVTDETEILLPFEDAPTENFVADQSISGWNDSIDVDSNDLTDNENVIGPVGPSVQVNAPLTLRRSERQPHPKTWPDFITYSVRSLVCDEPQTVAEALSREDGHLWKKAILDEYNSLLVNNTWDLVDLPENRKAIPCKWVFKTKRDGDGAIERRKARLVIKGFAQRQGIDYEETFSPVVRYNSLRYLLSLAAEFDLDIDQFDAVSAFLQGDVEEEIFMTQPEEFAKDSKVCRLNKAIYGLKQASRQWNKKLDHALKEIGFHQSSMDPCIYYRINGRMRTYIAIYVDDSMVFSNDHELKKFLVTELFRRFEMKYLGEAKFCLGLRITRDRKNGILYLDQRRHIVDLLEKFNMTECNQTLLPVDANQKLSTEMCPKSSTEMEIMSKVPYQEAVGSLLYISQGSRPDIAYAVNSVSRFNHNPGKVHWEAVKRIMRYLKGTMDAKLTYSRSSESFIFAYCDADWAADVDERRSCTGYAFIKQGGAISWNSKRQPTIALSSAEAEYMSLSACAQEALWFRQLGLDLYSNDDNSIRILCDNKSAIDLSNSNGYKARTKHIDIRHHFVRESIQNELVRVDHVSTEMMLADILTKPLTKEKHLYCAKGLGMTF